MEGKNKNGDEDLFASFEFSRFFPLEQKPLYFKFSLFKMTSDDYTQIHILLDSPPPPTHTHTHTHTCTCARTHTHTHTHTQTNARTHTPNKKQQKTCRYTSVARTLLPSLQMMTRSQAAKQLSALSGLVWHSVSSRIDLCSVLHCVFVSV